MFKIISARDIFAKDYPTKKWKIKTFKLYILENHDKEADCQYVLSMGDSSHEHEALLKLQSWKRCKPKERRILKSIQLTKCPNINELVEQLTHFLTNLNSILDENVSDMYTIAE